MLLRMLLLFTIVPLLELWLLIKVGQVIGAWPTVLLVALTGFFGVLLARSQGMQVLYRMQYVVQSNALPAEELLDGVCILVGGALLLTPGIITDIFGFALLFPFTRALMKETVKKMLRRKMTGGTVYIYRRR